jgi:hypothetical protein
MIFAADYPLLDVFWTTVIFFAWVAWFWILVMVLGDVFRRHDISGLGKAGWVTLCVFLPMLGVLIYLIAHGKDMGERRAQEIRGHQAQFDQHIKSVAASSGPSNEIAQAKQLLDSGVIDDAEFQRLKQHAVAAA